MSIQDQDRILNMLASAIQKKALDRKTNHTAWVTAYAADFIRNNQEKLK